jgi:hypothetical protein
MLWIIGIGIVIVFVVAIVSGLAQAKALEEAKNAYAQSLDELKLDPANSDLRQRTLALGREYASASKDDKGVSLFDEVALMNDINAACASTQHAVAAPASATAESVAAKLQILRDLLDKGLITMEDFERRKAEILSAL